MIVALEEALEAVAVENPMLLADAFLGSRNVFWVINMIDKCVTIKAKRVKLSLASLKSYPSVVLVLEPKRISPIVVPHVWRNCWKASIVLFNHFIYSYVKTTKDNFKVFSYELLLGLPDAIQHCSYLK